MINDSPRTLQTSVTTPVPHAVPLPVGVKVLAVDASPAARDALATCLRRDGHRVLPAGDTGTALEMLARERPAVAMIERGAIDGLLRHLRAAAPGLPIIVYGEGDPHTDAALARDGGLAVVEDATPERLREALGCALTAARCVERLRHEQELRGVALVQLCQTLRAPLDVIQGYTELLRDAPGPDSQVLLDGLSCAVANVMKLAREHLALASLEVPESAVRRDPVDVGALLDDLRRAAARPLGGRRVRLVASAPPRGAVLFTDGDKLRALLAQLMVRAGESALRGILRLTVRATADATIFELIDRPSAASRGANCSTDALGDALQGEGLELVQRLATLLSAQVTSRRGPTGAVVFIVRLPSTLTLLPAEAALGTLH